VLSDDYRRCVRTVVLVWNGMLNYCEERVVVRGAASGV
jgi:hypothetical protein